MQIGIKQFSICLFLFLCSCSGLRISPLDSSAVVKSVRRDILSSGKLSPESEQAIRMAGLTEKEAMENGGDFLFTASGKQFQSFLKQMYVGSEISLSRALSLEKSKPQQASGYYLRAGRLALSGMLSEECKQNVNLLCDNFKIYYLRSTLALLQLLKDRKWDGSQLGEIKTGADEVYTLNVKKDDQYETPENYETITASALISAEGLANRHLRYGMGLPLTACRRKREELALDKYLPKVGTCLPLTAVLTFKTDSSSAIEAVMEFHNALETEKVKVENQELVLAANFTAPFASLVEKTGLGDFDGLFSAFSGDEKLLQDTGFYTVEPYASGKIPLITVHGLFSSPVTWLSLHNDLMGDPLIREHYQLWHYMYPTNLPILENASTFRHKLDELEADLKKNSSDGSGLKGMVVIAHSMGGLLTRTAIARENPDLQDSLFESADKIKEFDAETQQQLNDILGFDHKPYLDRVIFVAVPHRGSPMSESFVGWIGKALISMPEAVLQKTEGVVNKIRDIARPELKSGLDGQDPSSVKGLSPASPTIQILSKVAIDTNVPFHSIIGNGGKGGPKEEASDGVVPYNSSHLEGAESELIVPAEHSAHTNPLAVQEIKRILYLHLEKLKGQAALTPQNKKQ